MRYVRDLGTGPVSQGSAGATLVLLLTTSAVLPQQVDLIAMLADGKPWKMVQTGGETGMILLTADGQARMQINSRSMSPTWRSAGRNQLCLKPIAVAPERCVTLQREGAVIIGINNGTEQFRLSR